LTLKNAACVKAAFFLFFSMPYEFTDSKTNADIGLLVTADGVEELFAEAAVGMTEIMADLDGVLEKRQLSFELKGDDLEELFYSWLSDLVYYKDVEGFLVKRCEVEIKRNKTISLSARLFGDDIDPQRQTLKADIKAITYYGFRIEQKEGQWQAEVVFDL